MKIYVSEERRGVSNCWTCYTSHLPFLPIACYVVYVRVSIRVRMSVCLFIFMFVCLFLYVRVS